MSATRQRAPILGEADHRRVSDAVARAEAGTAGEIVTVLTESSDGYTDVALAWAALVALLSLAVLALAPAVAMSLAEQLQGGWVHDWTPREILTLAAVVTGATFGAMVMVQAVPAVRFLLVPRPIRAKRVHDRALRAFRVGAERRTVRQTGILIYLSMREHRAEILADVAIASVVDAEVWAEALAALLARARVGDVAGGMCAAIEQVGVVLAEHFPRQENGMNELPDRLIEV